jgi:hypothetical protein
MTCFVTTIRRPSHVVAPSTSKWTLLRVFRIRNNATEWSDNKRNRKMQQTVSLVSGALLISNNGRQGGDRKPGTIASYGYRWCLRTLPGFDPCYDLGRYGTSIDRQQRDEARNKRPCVPFASICPERINYQLLCTWHCPDCLS